MRPSTMMTVAAAVAALVSGTPAFASHDHPAKAPTFLAWFVRAYGGCTASSTSHLSPLSFPACVPVPASTSLAWGPSGSGSAKYVVKLNSVRQATDIAFVHKFVDVVDTGTGLGFDGYLSVTSVIRITDHDCAAPGPCTIIDIPFPVSVPCGSAAVPPLAPGKCRAKGTANGNVPGAVVPGNEANFELGQVQVYVGSNLAFVQGLQLN